MEDIGKNLELEEVSLNDNVENLNKEPSTSDCDEEETITGNLLTNKQEDDLDNVPVNNIKNIGEKGEDEKDVKFSIPVFSEEIIDEEIEENPFCDTQVAKAKESVYEKEYSDVPLAWEDK